MPVESGPDGTLLIPGCNVPNFLSPTYFTLTTVPSLLVLLNSLITPCSFNLLKGLSSKVPKGKSSSIKSVTAFFKGLPNFAPAFSASYIAFDDIVDSYAEAKSTA